MLQGRLCAGSGHADDVRVGNRAKALATPPDGLRASRWILATLLTPTRDAAVDLASSSIVSRRKGLCCQSIECLRFGVGTFGLVSV